MATTTNFGWTTPNDTDLVKDGAAAIRTLGSSIDTSMAGLKGGTTGQVLSKTSGTDMAFTWVAQDDSNAIQNALVDAKGDLIAASANDTPARLAVGNNGETLVADSSTSTGLRYQAPVNVNPVLNSAMQVWQRGTSSAVTASSVNYYSADRWQPYTTAAGRTISRQVTGDTTNLPNIQYCMRVQRDSANTSTAYIQTAQSFESINSIPYAGKTVTFSFYARAGANYSATSNALAYYLVTGTGTDQNLNNGFTGQVNLIAGTATLTTTWQRFTATATISSSATQLGINFAFTPTGTAGANDYYEMTGIQVEVGSVATPFKTNGATIQGELAACQRYGYSLNQVSGAGAVGTGFNYSTTQGLIYVTLPVSMRTVPTVTYTSPTGANVYSAIGGQITTTAMSGSNHSTTTLYVIITVSAGLVAGNGNAMLTGVGTTQILFASAEL